MRFSKFIYPMLFWWSFPAAIQAQGMDNLLSSQSFTGGLLTPNAQVMDHGDFSYLYGRGVPYQQKIAELDNHFFSVGLFQGLEVGGRVVTQTYDCNLYLESGCGIRDLSTSFKYQLPFIYDYTGLNLAVGIQDVGGAANNFEAVYGVADYEFSDYPVRLSAGYGQSKLSNDIMNGAFGLVELQPLSFMQLIAEYDASQVNSAAKLFTPEGLLPLKSQLAVQYQIHTGHDSSFDNNQHIWSVNASIPLLGFNFNQAQDFTNKEYLTTLDLIAIEQQKTDSADLNALKKALKDEGFLNIRIAYNDRKIFIALENRRYNQNQLDGIGVALGIISSYAGKGLFADLGIDESRQNIELYSLTNDIPVFKVVTSADCYREFIKTGEECKDLQFQSSDVQLAYQNTAWFDEKEQSGFGRTQVILSPALRHNDATEYGVYDYSLALATNIYTPLWKGAAVDLRHLLPVSNSDDYDDGKIWQNSRFENKVDRALLHQAFQIPFNIMTQFSGGYVYGGYVGLINESQWVSESGRNSLGFEISEFRYKDELDEQGRVVANRATTLGNYQISVPEWDWQFKAQAGKFRKGDTGFKLTTSHWLGDVRLDASFQQSTEEDAAQSEQFVTLGLAIPLTLWRDMSPGYVQVRGIDQFTYAVQTRVGEEHNNLGTGLGADIGLQHNLSRQYNNRDRMSVVYFEENSQRLRSAYLRYIKQVN
ncbi:YjbH domain-containing protein [Psychromonas ossibalaenae]|uniref:YjbH domain-containing protein n=1 Tax=Psychromonas ossibalaenae TaxID=444922 RepID=UPI00036DBB40|nr:YjbH domain-containing protein [Psychromonas ossibalaenae]